MIYYTIKNKKNGRYVSGTNFNYSDGKPRQILHTANRPPLLLARCDLITQLRHRRIDLRHYEVVAVRVKEQPTLEEWREGVTP